MNVVYMLTIKLIVFDVNLAAHSIMSGEEILGFEVLAAPSGKNTLVIRSLAAG
jgi:hypothetical protein